MDMLLLVLYRKVCTLRQSDLNRLLKEIVLPGRTLGRLHEKGIVYNVDLLLRTEQEIKSIPQFGPQAQAELRLYLISKRLRLRKPNETVIGRLEHIFGDVRRAPVSCLTVTGVLHGTTLKLKAAGKHQLGDLEGATPQQLVGYFNRKYIHAQSALVQNIIVGLAKLGLHTTPP